MSEPVLPHYLVMIDRFAARGLPPSAIREAMGRLLSAETIEAVVNRVRVVRAAPAKLPLLPRPKLAFRVITVRAVPGDRSGPSAADIIAEVAARHGLTPDDLRTPTRNRRVVQARHEAMYEVAVRTRLSTPQIGRALGGFDHTTVIHAIRRHAERNDLPSPRGITPKGH